MGNTGQLAKGEDVKAWEVKLRVYDISPAEQDYSGSERRWKWEFSRRADMSGPFIYARPHRAKTWKRRKGARAAARRAMRRLNLVEREAKAGKV